MSTTANIHVGIKSFFISHDGYPEDVMPALEEVVEKARAFIERNKDFNLIKAIEHLLSEDEDMSEGGVSQPCFEYTIEPDGSIHVTGC